MREKGVYAFESSDLPAGSWGSETIGFFTADEPDMYGDDGMVTLHEAIAAVPAGYLAYANFGIYITMGMGGGSYTAADFFNELGIGLQSVDQYFY